jgi:outer membrane protein assembly factor BamB
MRRVFLAAAAVVGASAAAGWAGDWAQFRGPHGAGVAADAELPTKWSRTDGLRWTAALPSRGVSSPVVVGGTVYVTCSSGPKDDRLHVLAFDAKTGKAKWQRQLAATGGTNCHPMTCMAAPTPAADGTGVYALFATGDLAALDADGSLRWYRSLVGDYPTITNQVGMASSPVLYRDRLLVPMDNAGESFLAAIDTATGRNVWKTPRPRDVNWVTPVVREAGGAAEVLFPANGELIAYDLATGAKRWSVKGPGGGIPSPAAVGDVVYVPGGGLTAVKPEGTTAKTLWKSPRLGGGMASPLVYDGVVYATASGVLKAADAATGKEIWSERFKGTGKATASPVAGAGKVYVFDEKGTATVFKAGKATEELAVNKLDEETISTPAVADGALFVRTDKALYCIGAK